MSLLISLLLLPEMQLPSAPQTSVNFSTLNHDTALQAPVVFTALLPFQNLAFYSIQGICKHQLQLPYDFHQHDALPPRHHHDVSAPEAANTRSKKISMVTPLTLLINER